MKSKVLIQFILAMCFPILLSAQWESVDTPQINSLVNNMKFFNDDTGVLLADYGCIEITFDGGVSWSSVLPPGIGDMQDFFYFDSDTYVVQSSMANLMLTETDGEIWDYVSIDFMMPDATGFLHSQLGYSGALGIENATIGQAIFKLESIGPYAPAQQVYFTGETGYFDHILCINEQEVLASFRADYPLKSFILRSDDQGANWEKTLQIEPLKGFRKLDISVDGNCVYALSWDSVFYTMDKGISWEGHPCELRALDLISRQEAYGVIETSGFGTFVDTSNLAYTNDAWQTWAVQHKLPFDVMMMDRNNILQMVNENTGYWAWNNQLYKTTNGGFVSVPDNHQTVKPGLFITPNPAYSHIKIEIPGSIHMGRVIVFNNLGTKVKEQQFSVPEQILQINTSKWQAGVYQVAIFSEQGEIFSGKVIIK